MVVGATNVGTGAMEFFDRGRPGGLTFEHVVASGSLPPSFPMTEIGEESYWDGGLFSNTPLGPAINALKEAAGGDRAVERELIVVELFPMRAEVPRTLPDVLQRMVQLQYTSRLALDGRSSTRSATSSTWSRGSTRRCPPTAPIRHDPLWTKLRAHRQIDHLNVVTSSLPPRAVHRRGLLARLDRGPYPCGPRRRRRAGDRQPAGARPAVRHDPGAGTGVRPAPRPDGGRPSGQGAAGRPPGASPAGIRGQPSPPHASLRRPRRGAPPAVPS